MIAELISAILENFIYDITSTGIKCWFDKIRQKKFLKGLRNSINEFCKKNECFYLDSSAFEYFIRNTRFVERVIERAIATKLDNSNKDFFNAELKKARDIANTESIPFSNNEEQIIKDLFHIIDDKVGNYYRSKLSVEQRHMVAVCIENISKLQDSVEDFKDKSLANDREILNTLRKEIKISDAKADIIADLLSAELRDGRFKEFDDLAAVVKDKSEDLAIFHESLSRIICQEDCAEAVRKIADIHNTQVRDSAIRMALPVLLFRKETIDTFPDIISAGSLREIVSCLVEGKMDGILAESVSFENGVEIHNFTINKKLAFEEAWLTKQIAVLILFDKRVRNIYCIMEEVQKGTETWLTEILIADRKIEKYTGECLYEDNVSGLSKLLESLQRNVGVYNRLCGCIRAFYYSVLVKIYLLLNRVEDAEKNIPDELKSYRPLSDYVLAIKNEKNEIDIEDLYEYSVRNETYWLINNYFVVRKSATELISFCKEHEELFEKDIPLFFMYIGALNASGLQEERKTQLDKQSDKLRFIYEYWNEMLDLDPSEQVQKDFVAACRDGKMSGVVSSSEYLMIERYGRQKYW